jgi:hypothetical protein
LLFELFVIFILNNSVIEDIKKIFLIYF